MFFYDGQYIGSSANGAPTHPLSAQVSISLATANSVEDIPVPGAGHAYVVYWVNSVPQASYLQAGPVNGYLGQTNYSQVPSIDPHYYVALSPSGASAMYQKLQSLVSTYQANFNAQEVPRYSATTINSNSWVDGLFLADGYQQSTLDSIVSFLQYQGLRSAVGYGNGNLVEPAFLGRIGT